MRIAEGYSQTLNYGLTNGQMSTCESRVTREPQSPASTARTGRRTHENPCAACPRPTPANGW